MIGALNIDSTRFSLRADGTGSFQVRDRSAPYHLHTVPADALPPLSRLSAMTEGQFDRAVSAAIYD